MSDPAKYRTREEVQKMRAQRDPIEAVRTLLVSQKYSTEEEIKIIDKEIKEIINECAEFAKESPEVSAEELWTDIYA
jgi:pyruvate dehydrogenase E1 component alpha subunit